MGQQNFRDPPNDFRPSPPSESNPLKETFILGWKNSCHQLTFSQNIEQTRGDLLEWSSSLEGVICGSPWQLFENI